MTKRTRKIAKYFIPIIRDYSGIVVSGESEKP